MEKKSRTKNHCRWYLIKRKQTHIKTFTYFPNRRCRCWENIHTHVFYAIHVAILYKTNAIYVDPLKPKIMKFAYTSKVSFNINGTTIHFALVILLKKKIMNSNH
jgi:hypothetical protein